MSDIRAAIVMLSRDEAGRLRVVDSKGHETTIESDEHLRATVDGILDDPEMPQMEQVARLEQAAQQMIAAAAASFLPEVARPLAAPLVADLADRIRRRTAMKQQQSTTPPVPREPPHEREARARTARITKSHFRLGGSVKRRGDAA